MKMPKWLTRMEFVDKEFLGYWEWQGWSNSSERQLQSVVDDPHDNVRISGTNFVDYGVGDRQPSGRAQGGGIHRRRTSLGRSANLQQP